MTTPNRNSNVLESPYAKNLPQYPSQSVEYLPLELGGPGTCGPDRGQNNSRGGRGGGGGGIPHFYQNRQTPQRGRGNNRFHGDGGGGRKYNNQQYGGGGRHRDFEHRQNYRQRGFDNRGGGGGYQSHKQYQSKDADSSQYFHPSMLEDPWKDLMERYNAIRNSQVDLQPQKKEASEDLGDSSPERYNLTEENID